MNVQKCINYEWKHLQMIKYAQDGKIKEIQKIKTERNVSHMEAKKFRKVFSSSKFSTYAQVSALKKA